EHEAGGAGDVGDEVGATLGGGELAQHVVEERDGLLTAIGVGERDRGEAAQLARRKARGAGIPQRLEREDRGIVRAARRDEPADAVLSEADEEQVRVVARQRLEARLGEREAARALLGRILLAAERDEAQRGGRARVRIGILALELAQHAGGRLLARLEDEADALFGVGLVVPADLTQRGDPLAEERGRRLVVATRECRVHRVAEGARRDARIREREAAPARLRRPRLVAERGAAAGREDPFARVGRILLRARDGRERRGGVRQVVAHVAKRACRGDAAGGSVADVARVEALCELL